jgi:hypothetical protein
VFETKNRDLQLHVNILAWLLIISHALFLLLGIGLFLLLTGVGAASGDGTAMAVLSIVGSVLGLFFAVLALPGMLAGFGLLAGRSWGRLLSLVVGILGLVNFPVGTAIGIYALWVLLPEDAAAFFKPLKIA